MKFKVFINIALLAIVMAFTVGGACDDDGPTSSEDGFVVTLRQPGNFSTNFTNYVTLMWSCPKATGHTRSTIYFDTVDYGGKLPETAIIDTVYDVLEYRLNGLETNQSYYWTIRVKADNGLERPRYDRVFYTGDVFLPARKVYNPTPDSAAVGISINPQLTWQCCNPEMETINYDLFFGTSSSPPLVSSHQSDTAFTPDTLALDETYYWQVVSYNDSDDPVEGPLWFFTTTDMFPGTPYNPSPSDDSTNVETDGQLHWRVHQPDDVPLYWDIYFDTLSDPVKVTDSTRASIKPFQDLEQGRTYYWKIVVFRTPTDSVVGPTWKFTTITPTYGVYSKIEFDSRLNEGIFATEEIRIRFDSSYAPSGPIDTLAADSVKVNGNLMDYFSYSGIYIYAEDPSVRWMVNGATYLINVYGNSDIPSMIYQTEFLECSPRITSPANMATVSTDGFEVSWEDYCTGSVRLVFMQSGDTTDVSVNTANDGAYFFSAHNLAPLVGHAGFYDLVLIFEQTDALGVTGYDSRSVVVKRSSHAIAVYVE